MVPLLIKALLPWFLDSVLPLLAVFIVHNVPSCRRFVLAI